MFLHRKTEIKLSQKILKNNHETNKSGFEVEYICGKYDLSFSYDVDHPVNDHSSGRKFKMKLEFNLGTWNKPIPEMEMKMESIV